MSTATARETMVGMGQAVAAHAPDRLWSILGSCVAVALCDPRRKAAALGHVVLPTSSGRAGTPAKFADTAVPHMLDLLRQLGIPGDGLVAKLAGGAKMFGRNAPLEVGESNFSGIVEALKRAGIRVAGKDVGGTRGRRVELDCARGTLSVQILGSPPIVL